jgi:hypothetical protein
VHYGSCKKAVEYLATVDCLFSLAKVAKMPGYVWLVIRVAYRIFSGGGGGKSHGLLIFFVRVYICNAATHILVNNYFLEVQ